MKPHWPLLVLLTLVALPVSAAEQILAYHSEIAVESDGSMLVEETIQVRAEGRNIKRGIYRDFPTDYADRYGHSYKVMFKVVGVERDGSDEPYHLQRQSNGWRVYVGSENIYLQPGIYTYTLRYRTNRQLGFFDDHDELYWNVTGNGWDFPILKASASVRLPEGIDSSELKLEAYTGAQGSKEQAYRSASDRPGVAAFETTRPLAAREGLTIVVGWPKGIISEPTVADRLQWLVADNASLLWMIGGVLVLLAYYAIAWHLYGRDPKKGVIIPEYDPPKGYSPASIRYIWNMGYDDDAFASAVINLAVKGYVTIDDKRGAYALLKAPGEPQAALAPGEKALFDALFGSGKQRVDLKKKNHQSVSDAISAHKKSILRDYEKRYFATNRGLFFIGILLTIAVIVIASVQIEESEAWPAVIFLTVWLSAWSPATLFLWREYWRGRGSSSKGSGVPMFVAIAFTFFEVMALGMYIYLTSLAFAIVVVIAVLITVIFAELLKAPTLAGRKLLDKLEGFKLYLEVAEMDELNLKHAPEKTPELFERYLPYALALGVQNEWAERFASLFDRLEKQGKHVQPSWYQGHGKRFTTPASLVGAVGSGFSSAISSASTPPGSSGSGFSSSGGGGGSSGGGGGGGGGGGW